MVAAGAVDRSRRGASLGVILGLGGWIGIAPPWKPSSGRASTRFDVPWWLVAVGCCSRSTTCILAAWWPGRTMSRVPPIVALSGRTPRPSPLDRSVAAALGCLLVGAALLRFGSRGTDRAATTPEIVAILAGTLGIAGGVLLISPLAMRAVARLARRSPASPRLALRDLGRHQARSGAALAAISLALGIPIAVVAAAASADNHLGPGNLSPTQLIARPADLEGPFIADPASIPELQTGVDAVVDALLGGSALRLNVAVERRTLPEDDGSFGRPAMSVNRPVEGGWQFVSSVYVADEALLAVYGLEPSDIPPDADVLTADEGRLALIGAPTLGGDRVEPELVAVAGTLPTAFASLPGALMTPEAAAARGWDVVASGRWLVQAAHTPIGRRAARRSRGRCVARARARGPPTPTPGSPSSASARSRPACWFALAILAMTVGLIRSESTRDLRTLTATGATSTTRRNLTAVTAAALALLGAVLGTAGAYVGLAAGHLRDLTPLPATDLVTVIVGTPLVAAAAAWLLAGREPPTLARSPIG